MTRLLVSPGTALALCVVLTLAMSTPASQGLDETYARIRLTTGRSHVLVTDFDVTRVAVTNPAIADVLRIDDREILIDGKSLGTVSLILWGGDRRVQYDVVVEPGISTLQQQLRVLFPSEDIRLGVADEAIVLSGRVSSNQIVSRAVELAQAAAPKLKVVNWLEGPVLPKTQQVMLQVRFAEVASDTLAELGATLFQVDSGRMAARTTVDTPAPDFQFPDLKARDASVSFSDFLNVFYFDLTSGIGAAFRALERRGQFRSLAEPNLIAYDGQEASFLAGGEFPIPVVQGSGTGSSVTVLFKEFGVRLTFRPTITGDLIRLRVRPEVSSLDFGSGIQLSGFVVPALITRRAETEVELRDGQSFAIAGLLNNTTQTTRSAIPFLSKVPVLGTFFKSNADRSERTELLVLITPRLVRPLEPAEVPPLPTDSAPVTPGFGTGPGGGGVPSNASPQAGVSKGSQP